MQKKNKILIIVIAIVLICGVAVSVIFSSGSGITKGTENITDMAGRTVSVPSPIESVICTSPSMTTVVYMIAPDKLKAINDNWKPNQLEFVPDKYKDLPVIGGWYGTHEANYEEFISKAPDVVFESVRANDIDTINDRQDKMGDIPVVGVFDTSILTNNSNTILFVGKLLGEEATAQKLVDFNEKNIKDITGTVSSIPNKKNVYYAEGDNGLKTDGSKSQHAQLIKLAGGNNVADSVADTKAVDVSIEQVISWNPDVIITTDPEFYDNVYKDSNWAEINAVKNHDVYLAPQSPYNWFDMPVGINMIMGLPWVAKCIYPDEFKDLDLVGETQYFYSNFYHFDLSKDQAKQILLDSGLKEENL